MKTFTVNYQKSYVVTPSEDGTIKTSEGVTICSFTAGSQSVFVAPCEEVQCSDDDAIITRSFNFAPLGSSSSGGGSSYTLPTATAWVLGGVKLSSEYTSTTTTGYAATPYAVKLAYDRGSSALTTAGTNATAIGTLSSLSTSSKTDLVSAINEVKSSLDDIDEYELPTATTSVMGGVKLLSSYNNISTTTYAATPYAVYAVYQFTQTNATAIGTLSNLTTSVQTDLVSAINEVAASAASSMQSYVTISPVAGISTFVNLYNNSISDVNASSITSSLALNLSFDDWAGGESCTAELWLQIGSTVPTVTWDSSCIWIEGTSEGTAPTLAANTKYRFVVRQEPDSQIIINLAYSYATT